MRYTSNLMSKKKKKLFSIYKNPFYLSPLSKRNNLIRTVSSGITTRVPFPKVLREILGSFPLETVTLVSNT